MLDMNAADRRIREERRPKNAGVHSDQNARNHTRANRRAAKQKLKGQYR